MTNSGFRIQDSRSENSAILNFEFLILNSREAGFGFTLIEILISLTLLTIVLGAVYSSFFSVQNVLDRFDNVSLKYHEARTALDIMRRELEGAILKIPAGSGNDNYSGIKDSTSFIIKDRDILGKNASGLELTSFTFKGNSVNTISYSVEENEGKLSLIKKEVPYGIQSKEYSMDLIEGIEGFSVETLFNTQWVRTWNSSDTDKLPDVLRLSIEFDDNGKKVRLVEYARPKITGK